MRSFPTFAFGLLTFTVSLTSAGAQRTYKTLDIVQWIGTNGLPAHVENAAACRLPGEDLPADQDTNGNWGFLSEGFQLSIRFEKTAFSNNEPIVASIILRNVSESLLEHVSSKPDKTEFILHNEGGIPVERIDVFRQSATIQQIVMGASRWPLNPGEQRKYKVVLNQLFDLSRPDTYFVTTSRSVPRLVGTGFGEVLSGIATIQIVRAEPSAQTKPEPASLSRSDDTPSRPTDHASRIIEGATAQSAGTPVGLTRTGATILPSVSTTYAPEAGPQPDSSPSRSESGDSHLGVVPSTVRIGAAVLVLLAAATFVWIRFRRFRPHS